MLNRNRRRESRWWLMAWRIGGAALFVAAVAGFGQQAFAATQPGRKDPATLLQCDGQQFSVGEFLYTTETSTDTPQQIADRMIGQRRDELGSRAVVAQRTAFATDHLRDVALTDADGATRTVLSMANDPRFGWKLEAIYACA